MASRREPRFGFEQRTLEMDLQALFRDRLPMTRSRGARLQHAAEAQASSALTRPQDLGSRFRFSFGGVRLPD